MFNRIFGEWNLFVVLCRMRENEMNKVKWNWLDLPFYFTIYSRREKNFTIEMENDKIFLRRK